MDPLNHIIDNFPAGREEEKLSYYQFLTCWIHHSPMRVKNDKYFIVNPKMQTWGVRQDITHYVELSIVALALVLQSLHQVVEQTTNTVLWPFILNPHDRYMKALASQKTEPLLRYYNVMFKTRVNKALLHVARQVDIHQGLRAKSPALSALPPL